MDFPPDIISSPVVNEEWNAFWEDISPLIKDMPVRDTLVISLPLEASDPGMPQLRKMLQACNLAENDYNLLQVTEDQKIAWYQLREQLRPRQVITLGIGPQQLGLSVFFMPHQVNRFNDVSWLPTLDIPRLEQNPDIKKHYWSYGLKPVFIEKAYS